MSGLENIAPNIRRQYEDLWGPYAVSGDYQVGDTVGDIVGSGEVLWRYMAPRGLSYIIVRTGDFPQPILARDVLVR